MIEPTKDGETIRADPDHFANLTAQGWQTSRAEQIRQLAAIFTRLDHTELQAAEATKKLAALSQQRVQLQAEATTATKRLANLTTQDRQPSRQETNPAAVAAPTQKDTNK